MKETIKVVNINKYSISIVAFSMYKFKVSMVDEHTIDPNNLSSIVYSETFFDSLDEAVEFVDAIILKLRVDTFLEGLIK